ncbi:MAG: hypothetical protein ACFHXK_16980 [bacterium]
MRRPSLRKSRHRAVCVGRCLALAALLLCGGSALALDADVRLKWFGSAAVLPEHDLQRQLDKTPAYDQTYDMRLMFRHNTGPFRFALDHSTILLSGDAAKLGQDPNAALDQTVTNDARRWADMTWDIEDGARHQSFHRLDRLSVQWQSGNWSVSAGRQTVSWGSGIVFQPLDLFSPFSPTVVDRDYKPGDDLLLVDHLLDNGSDLQLLHVVRRDGAGDVSRRVASTAFKWHGYAGASELELLAARHFDEHVLGMSLRRPLGEAMLRADLVAVRSEARDRNNGWQVSGIVNFDYTLVAWTRNVYLFGEYFYNDWGVAELPEQIGELPASLVERLARGELFNVMQHYAALGGSVEWHPLVSQNATLITNLQDQSSLLQVAVSFNPGDHQALQLGWVQTLGRRGDEFGGIPVAGEQVTTGGGSRFYLRWTYFF